MADDPAEIRPYRSADLDDLYRICLQTAADGQDATALFGDPMLPGQVFAAPYGIFEPSLAWVAEDSAGAAGYVLGALDTRAFEERLERDWWPALRAGYPDPGQVAAAVSELELFTLQWYGLSEFSAMLHDAGFPQVTIDADYRAASTRQKAAGCGHSRPPATEIPHPNWPARPSR